MRRHQRHIIKNMYIMKKVTSCNHSDVNTTHKQGLFCFELPHAWVTPQPCHKRHDISVAEVCHSTSHAWMMALKQQLVRNIWILAHNHMWGCFSSGVQLWLLRMSVAALNEFKLKIFRQAHFYPCMHELHLLLNRGTLLFPSHDVVPNVRLQNYSTS